MYCVVSGIIMMKEQKRIEKLNSTVDNLLNTGYNYDIVDVDGMGFSHPMPPKDRKINDISRNRLAWNTRERTWKKTRH
jgi:hypothetical protein